MEKYKVVTFKDGTPRAYSNNCETKLAFEDHVRVCQELKSEYDTVDFFVAIDLEEGTAKVY